MLHFPLCFYFGFIVSLPADFTIDFIDRSLYDHLGVATVLCYSALCYSQYCFMVCVQTVRVEDSLKCPCMKSEG